MDPNETLRQIRALLKQLQEEDGNPPYPTFVQHARDLAENVEALDEWLTRGGFKPATWDQPKDRVLVAHDTHLWGRDEDGQALEFNLDVLVNLWSNGTAEVAVREPRYKGDTSTTWGVPAPLVEET